MGKNGVRHQRALSPRLSMMMYISLYCTVVDADIGLSEWSVASTTNVISPDELNCTSPVVVMLPVSESIENMRP